MLIKRKENENGHPHEPEVNVLEASFGPDRAPAPKESKTVIGEQMAFEGSIRGKENLVVEGKLKGNVELEGHQLVIGKKGEVEGEVLAKDVIVSGRMTGNLKALGRVEITKHAEFNGEIKAKRISVEDGAYLKAAVELDHEEEKKSVPADQPDFQSKAAKISEPLPLVVPFAAAAYGSK